MVRRLTRTHRRLVLALAGAHVLALASGVGAGVLLSRDIPSVTHLDVFNLPQVTVLEDRDGAFLDSFGVQRRIPVPLSRMSPWYLKAVIAIEDPRFERHFGVDPIAVARAIVATARTMRFGVEGASTITMQLARDQFLHRRKTIWRKIQEAVLATQIEKHYSKQEILELYCNRIYLGHGRYGVEAASRFYFGKPARELTLPEAALLAGLAQRPEGLSPLRRPEAALERRNHVLRRMVIEGVIGEAEAREAAAAPLGVVERAPERPFAPYFIEEVRRWLLENYGEEGLYEEGLIVRTTLDRRLQRAAERAVAFGLDLYGRRHRLVPEGRPLPEGESPETYRDPAWSAGLQPDDIVPALVLEVDPKRQLARVRIADSEIELDRQAIAWTGERRIERVLAPGTLVPTRVIEVDGQGRPTRLELGSAPDADAALIAVDAATGEILALVGGRDFSVSEFDLAMQAHRQAGSAFKPFIYAAALERGLLPNQWIWDVPTAVVDRGSPVPYQPENYERDYEGLVTLRHSLEHSRNIPTLRLLDAIGYDPAIEMARRLGIATRMRAYPSLALGAFEVRLIDLVSAYAAFANGGVLVEPRMVNEVRHRAQQTLFKAEPRTREVLSPEIAGMMTSMLEGVVQRGTGRAARILRRPLAGKTGTTDDFTNAWFVGFSPSIAVGVWVGHASSNATLGRGETGARAALPIWIRFFELGLGPPEGDRPAEEFARPPGLMRVLVDARTGLRSAGRACGPSILEAFPRGGEPVATCTPATWRRFELPYPLQRFEIDEAGLLHAAPEELARVVAASGGRISVVPPGSAVRWRWPSSKGSVRQGAVGLAWDAGGWIRFVDAMTLAREELRLRALAREQALEEIRARIEADDLEDDERGKAPEELLPAELRDGLDGFPVEVLEANRTGRLRELPAPRAR
ncbi:MAG: PBP1A family penicillin-binding protein [Acidobacteria bacterium]|nr:MAG: PBP1A family penicillin-binding protein [Acidobacteriota bacterium]